MARLQRRIRLTALTGLGLMAAAGSNAQVSSINSANVHSREFNDVPAAALTVVNNYPSLISFDEQNVTKPTGFANRDVWRFSNDGGASAYRFGNDDFFKVSMNVTLTANASPRKEAGFLFDTAGGQGQFLVNTDSHEVVAFGGPLPFFAFPPTFNSGNTITLGMTYFRDANGKRAIIYSANGVDSPVSEFGNTEQGLISNTTLGGYLQVQNSSTNAANFGTAAFSSIRISTLAVPEPSSLALLCAGGLSGVLLFRRRSRRAVRPAICLPPDE